MDGAQFAKMLAKMLLDKHLFELDRMEYKYSTVSVKEFAELLRQNFAQPLPLTDFSGKRRICITYIRSAQGIISRMKIDYCQTTFIGMARFLLWAVKNPDRDFRQSGFPVP